jgi:abequosyltransferase
MKNYLLSICIPTFNRASFLNELLEEITKEISKNKLELKVQLLVVDGNSKDNTSEIVKSFLNRIEIKYFKRETRVGVDKDILKCVELADGEYCWLFSDDDRIFSGAINHVVETLGKSKNLTGIFCNRVSYDFKMEKTVSESKYWPSQKFKTNYVFTNKADCFKYIGMDFGFISSQIVNKSKWQKEVDGVDFGDLYQSYYLMVHVIGLMMNQDFKWLYMSRALIKQRTGNDSLLNSQGVIERQKIEHNNFYKIFILHFPQNSLEFRFFFTKMVIRLPRVIANLKSQNLGYLDQLKLLKILHARYHDFYQFYFKVMPIFFIPNYIFRLIKKAYFKYFV